MKPAKQCRHCLNVCELTRFAKRSQSKDGHEGHCRDCEKARKLRARNLDQAVGASENAISDGVATAYDHEVVARAAAKPTIRVNALNDDQTLASAIAKVRPVKAAAAKRAPKAATK